jgi:hypothetical protein
LDDAGATRASAGRLGLRDARHPLATAAGVPHSPKHTRHQSPDFHVNLLDRKFGAKRCLTAITRLAVR